MSSQRHKREQNFFRVPYPDSVTPGDTIGPMDPVDASNDKASDYEEEAQWPDADRPEVVT